MASGFAPNCPKMTPVSKRRSVWPICAVSVLNVTCRPASTNCFQGIETSVVSKSLSGSGMITCFAISFFLLRPTFNFRWLFGTSNEQTDDPSSQHSDPSSVGGSLWCFFACNGQEMRAGSKQRWLLFEPTNEGQKQFAPPLVVEVRCHIREQP